MSRYHSRRVFAQSFPLLIYKKVVIYNDLSLPDTVKFKMSSLNLEIDSQESIPTQGTENESSDKEMKDTRHIQKRTSPSPSSSSCETSSDDSASESTKSQTKQRNRKRQKTPEKGPKPTAPADEERKENSKEKARYKH